jgi:spermidine synthase
MGLEIVGSRLLAPHFGNSVFVWGSLISLFLIALSAGYYIGGRLADRRPSRALLNTIVIAVAASMFVIVGIAETVCNDIVRQDFGEKAGPFVASAILFLLPSIGMGMVSPFAVRLATHTVASVGQTAGTLYALSTFGSIAGTMVTTFVLIPSMGAGAILKGLALALLATAVATFPFASRRAAAALVAIAVGAGGAAAYAINPPRVNRPLGSTLLVDVDTPYHHISVIDSVEGVRELKFDRYTESAISTKSPYESLSLYTNYFHLAFLPQPRIKRALFIGAGGGIGPRSFHAHDGEMEIEVVDIDAKVLELARSHFHLENSPRIKTIAADGRSYVRGAADGAYDCIVLDAFSIGGRIPFHLVTREFIDLCREKLADGGVFVMNINSALEGEKAQIFRSMYKTVAAAFPKNAQAFALWRAEGQPELSTNVILVGINSDEPASRDEWVEWADQYESASQISRADVARMVHDLVVTLPDLGDAPMFTDDYAPIETMPF